jgi:flavin-dependent dehydrogenase
LRCRPPSRCAVVSPRGLRAFFENPGEEVTVLDRAAFDQALADSAEEAGVSVRVGSAVDGVRMTRNCVEVSCSDGVTSRGRTVVLACGVTYRFHALLGSRPPAAVLHTAQTELDAQPSDALEIHLGRGIAPEGFAWLVPMRRGQTNRLKAGILMRGDARARLLAFLASPSVSPRLLGPPAQVIRRVLPVAPVRRSYGERVLAVGDAAGLTKPVTGGGIFYSLLSAKLAAETLVDAFRAGDVSAARLSQYQARWHRRLMPEIRLARWFRHLLANLSDEELDRFVDALASDDVRAVITRTARFNWHRPAIVAILRRPRIKAILLCSLFR